MEINKIINDLLFELKRVHPKSIEINVFLEKKSLIQQLSREIKKTLVKADIVDSSNKNFMVRINTKGIDICNNGGWTKYIEETEKEKEDIKADQIIQRRKAKIDLDLAEKMLKDYPNTRRIAWIGFGVAVVLGIVQLLQLFGVI